MKRRIGFLKGKPIIEGDLNLKTNNEISISELMGESSEIRPHYYKFTKPISDLEVSMELLAPIIASCKFRIDNDSHNFKYGFVTFYQVLTQPDIFNYIVAFHFCNVVSGHIYNEFRPAKDLEDFRYLYSLSDSSSAEKLDIIIDNIIEITEEEYFKIK